MKKTKLLMILMALAISTVNVFAAVSISISGPSTLGIGKTGTVSLRSSTSATFDVNISSSNSSVVSVGSNGVYLDSGSFNVTAHSAGTATITVSGKIDETNSGDKSTYSRSITINVPAPGGPSTPKPAPPTKTPEQIAKEKEAERLAAEKAEEERKAAELLEKKNTPLFDSLEIISRSDKRMDTVLISLQAEFEKFDYEYTLPKRIHDFDLNLITAQEGVTLTYDQKHILGEDENEKTISVKADGPDFSQDITVTVKRDMSIDSKITIGDKELTVYTDDLLTERLGELGFTHNEYPLSELMTSYFSLGSVNLQLLVNEENQAFWYILDNEFSPVREVTLIINAEGNPFFAYDSEDVDLIDKTLYGNKYEKVAYTVDEGIIAVDSSLKFKSDYKAWKFEEGHVAYGLDSSGNEGTYYVGADKPATLAIVAYDGSNNSLTPLTIASLVGFVSVSAYVLVTTIMNVRKRKSLQ